MPKLAMHNDRVVLVCANDEEIVDVSYCTLDGVAFEVESMNRYLQHDYPSRVRNGFRWEPIEVPDPTLEEIHGLVMQRAEDTHQRYTARLVEPSNAEPLILLHQQRRLLEEVALRLKQVMSVERMIAAAAVEAARVAASAEATT